MLSTNSTEVTVNGQFLIPEFKKNAIQNQTNVALNRIRLYECLTIVVYR